MAEKGEVDTAFKQLKEITDKDLATANTRAATLEQKWLSEAKSRVINQLITGLEFAGEDPRETANTVRELLEQEVDAVLDAQGNPDVRERGPLRRPALEYLQERLKSPRYSLFLKATNRGGAGSDGSRPAATTQQHAPNSYDAFAEQYRNRMNGFQQARIPQPGQLPAG